jgi:hypothetical protein
MLDVAVRNRSRWALLGVGLVVVAMYIAILLYLMERSTWDTWGAMVIGPVLYLISIPAFVRQAKRENDRRVVWLLVTALTVKFVFSLLRYHQAFNLVNKADAQAYDATGTEIALRFLSGDYSTGLEGWLDSNFIRLFTGLIYTVIRPTAAGAFLIYAWLAFWGTYFFYRAFVLAVPDGNRRSYGRWLFFLPSILFWPSSIGKESWLIFGLGIAAFGAAKVLSERVMPGLLVAALGIGLTALVRTPSAVAMGIGLVVGGFLRRPKRELRHLGPIAKLATTGLFVGLALVMFLVLQEYLAREGLGGQDIDSLLAESQRLTATGGSEFTPTSITSPIGLMIAAVTVLFRPFLFEANNAEAVVTALEASVLMVFTLVRWRSIWAAIRGVRRIPYAAVAITYVGAAIVALSAVANFGIIARQRTLIFPMFLVLLCVAPARRARSEADHRAEVPAAGTRALVGARR